MFARNMPNTQNRVFKTFDSGLIGFNIAEIVLKQYGKFSLFANRIELAIATSVAYLK